MIHIKPPNTSTLCWHRYTQCTNEHGNWGIFFCICGITFHLLYVFYQRFGERKHTVGIFGTIVFKFHHAIVRVIIRAGDADHFKIRTTDGVILFDGKSVTMAQIAGDKFVERTTDKVLINLIKDLCGNCPKYCSK